MSTVYTVLNTIEWSLATVLAVYLAIGFWLYMSEKWQNVSDRVDAIKAITSEFEQAVQNAELISAIDYTDHALVLIEQVENAIAEVVSMAIGEPATADSEPVTEIAEFDLESCDLPTLRSIAANHNIDGARLNRKTILKRLRSR